MADAVSIAGLREFQRSLKQMDSDLPKALRVAFNQAADIVVQEARQRIPTKSGKAKASVKARSTQTAARVVGGSARVPYYPWLDFGGRVGPGGRIRRPFLKDGRYIYAAYHANKERFTQAAVDAVVAVAQQAGLEVDHG